MEENYLISIVGAQMVENQQDEVVLTTSWSFREKNGKKYIIYHKYSERNPNIKTTSTLKIDGENKITLTKNGEKSSTLILEKGVRHYCSYDLGLGNMMLGVYTNNITCDLNKNGGTIQADYSLDINSTLISKNKILIKVKEKKIENV